MRVHCELQPHFFVIKQTHSRVGTCGRGMGHIASKTSRYNGLFTIEMSSSLCYNVDATERGYSVGCGGSQEPFATSSIIRLHDKPLCGNSKGSAHAVCLSF